MAKLVTKIKYLKPTARQNAGGYARYIATREGVEKIDDTKKLEPPTDKQIKLIEKIKKDFPDSTEIAALYDLWYKQREEVIRTYTDDLPEHLLHDLADHPTAIP